MSNDLISRSALHAAICQDTQYGTYGEFMDGSEVSFTSNEVHAMINNAPTIDPASLRPKGRWLYDSLEGPTYRICSHCASSFKFFGGDGTWVTCPICNADMRGDAMFE